MGRGKCWNPDEDMFLARSVVHVSHDPVVGADQKSSKYYERVLKQFLSFMPGSPRTTQALSSRWKEIQASCAKFAGHFSTVNALVRSGWQESEYIEAALKTFHEIEGSSFQYSQVWDYLRKHAPKFEDVLSPNSNRSKRMREEEISIDLTDNEDISAVEASGLKRPVGTKKAKALKRLEAADDDDDAIGIQRSYVIEAKRRNDLIEEQNRFALFSVDISSLDETAKQFHNLKRKIELAKLQKEAAELGIELN